MPLTPGFAHVRIKPQIGKLSHASGIMPTIRGPISVKSRANSVMPVVSVVLPGSVRAEVWLPLPPGWPHRHPGVMACINGRAHSSWRVVSGGDGDDGYAVLADVKGEATVTFCDVAKLS